MTNNQNIKAELSPRSSDSTDAEREPDVRSLKEDELDSVNGGVLHLALGAGILALALLTGHTVGNYKR